MPNTSSWRAATMEGHSALATFAESVAEKIVEFRILVDLFARDLEGILDALEVHRIGFEHHVARAGIAVARLTHATDVDQRFSVGEGVREIDLFRNEEVEIFGEDTRDVGVSLEAMSLHKAKDFFHLPLI